MEDSLADSEDIASSGSEYNLPSDEMDHSDSQEETNNEDHSDSQVEATNEDQDATQCPEADELVTQRSERSKKRSNKKKLNKEAKNRAAAQFREKEKRKRENNPKPRPPKKKKKSSIAWSFYDTYLKDGEEYEYCTECRKVGKTNEHKRVDSSSSNMLRHLRKKHPLEFTKKEDETKAAKGANSPNTVLNYMRKLGNWKVGSEKYVAMEKKLVKFVVSTNQPLSVVENEYFQDLLHPDFKAPCRKSFTQRSIVSCYEHTKEAFLFDINTTCTKNIGIQVDHTTAKNLTPFGNMCVQHIKDDFSLGVKSVGAFEYKGKHTAKELYNSFEGPNGLIETWKLSKYNRIYTTDSFSANVAAFKEKKIWVPCLAHVLHNTVKNGLSKTSRTASLHKKLQILVNHLHKSTDSSQLLQDNSYWLGVADLTVTSDCPTRWNAFLKCMERIKELQVSIDATMHEAKRPDLLLDKSELSLLSDLIEELKPFRNVTNMLCSNTRYTFNYYLTSKTYIEELLSKDANLETTDNTAVISELRTNMKNHFAKFKLPEKMLKFAQTAKDLSPDNMIYVILANDLDLSVIADPFIENLIEIVGDIEPGINTIETQIIGPSQPHVNVTPLAKKPKREVINPFFDILRPTGKMQTQPPTKVHNRPFRERIKNEVYDYVRLLQSTQHDIENELMSSLQGFDVAKWWNNNHNRFPLLSIAVKNIMCIPATSANCERSFSTLTDVITQKRHSLSAETTHRLTFIKHNLKFVPDYTVNKTGPQTVDEPTAGSSGNQVNVDVEEVEISDDNE